MVFIPRACLCVPFSKFNNLYDVWFMLIVLVCWCSLCNSLSFLQRSDLGVLFICFCVCLCLCVSYNLSLQAILKSKYYVQSRLHQANHRSKQNKAHTIAEATERKRIFK